METERKDASVPEPTSAAPPPAAPTTKKVAEPVPVKPASAEAMNPTSKQVVPLLEKAVPVLKAFLAFVDIVGPMVEKGIVAGGKLWTIIEPYSEEFAPIAIGFVMLFCGGYYPMLIAAVEAFRQIGWEKTSKSIAKLYGSYLVAREASRKDDRVDANNDGIADVNQITAKQLVTRKIGVVMMAVDPKRVNSALMGISSGCFAVVATLRVQFAQTVTLGAAIGDVFARGAKNLLTEPLVHMAPHGYEKWVPVGITWLARIIAISVAYFVQRVISAAHSALRGAQIMCRGLTKLANRYNFTASLVEEGTLGFTALTISLACLGFWTQLRNGFGLPVPFPLSILFWPLHLLEYIIGWAVYLAD